MRRALILALLTSLSVPAFAQTEPGEGQNVVVTGTRIQDFRDRLAACLARNCPTNEDVDATLALAEALFLNGDYAEGRSAVRASVGRNRDQARGYPEPVSDLYRATTRFARHIGLDREARTSSFEILNALQAGVPREDHRHFTARLEIAEVQMMSGNFLGARRELERLTRSARAAGREDVAIIAELRDRWYALIANPQSDAMSELIQWSRRTEPRERMRATGARIVLARIARSVGDSERADALLAEIGRSGEGSRRRLIHAPSYTLAQQAVRQGEDNDRLVTSYAYTLSRTLADHMDDSWIDVGFWIIPEGRVSGVEILRQGADTSWARPLLDAIGGRIYSAGSEASYRLERYTLTAGFETTTGSRLLHRSPAARVEYLDLTVNEPEARDAQGRTPPG